MTHLTRPLLLVLAALQYATNSFAAVPTIHERRDVPTDEGSTKASYLFVDYRPVHTTRQDDSPTELRILSLGASIMSGVGSTDGSGLRRQLRDALRFDGWAVNMVGSLHNAASGGTHPMKDNDHEAVSGDRIDQVHTRMLRSLGYKPNVVIINAGTNDANQAYNIDATGSRMTDMLNDLWAGEDMSEACVMLSTILKSNNTVGRDLVAPINVQLRKVVTEQAARGKCVYLADMVPAEGEGQDWINTWDDYVSDLIHPDDNGHKKMAYIFYNAIRQALHDGKIRNPSPDMDLSNPTCDKSAGNGAPAGGQTQGISGEDDGTYVHDETDMGVALKLESDDENKQWKFGRLFSAQYDDLVSLEGDSLQVWSNSADGKGEFTQINTITMPMTCAVDEINFIDMNADGLDDIVCITTDGDLLLATNNAHGDHAAGNSPTFTSRGTIKENAAGQGSDIRLADIDGDGRGDYGALTSDNGWHFYRNGGVGDAPAYWQDLGVRATASGKQNATAAGVRYVDLNGDGRGDWVFVAEDGSTDVWTNSRSCAAGKDGDGLNVAWRQGKNAGSEKYTHAPIAQGDEHNVRDRVFFARVYGDGSVVGNLPRLDRVVMERTQDGESNSFDMRVFKSSGKGSTKLKADGNKYCNMVGHKNTSISDLLWVTPAGEMTLHKNLENTAKLPLFDMENPTVIFTPPRTMDRRDLHLADWDGDGSCDVIYVHPDGGKVEVFLNGFPHSGSWSWTHQEDPASELHCDEKKGLGIHDLSVRFADVTGDGRIDYLCITKNGTVSALVQTDDGKWSDIGQIKKSEEKDRANLRFEDVNGDGKSDMIFIDKFTGDATVWYNEGVVDDPSTNAGSTIKWRIGSGSAFDGSYAGTCQYFTDLNGDRRADMHSITGSFYNTAESWFNKGCELTDETGDDEDPVQDPELPVQPGNPPVEIGERIKIDSRRGVALH